MISRFQKCIGLTLWRWNRFQVELWFCPKGERIPDHCHSNIDSTIVHLFGSCFGHINNDFRTILGLPKSWNIPAGVVHGAVVGGCWVFLNVERWNGNPTSAAKDITLL